MNLIIEIMTTPNEPTEAEIEAARELANELTCQCFDCIDTTAKLIHRQNDPLHAKIAAQKAALELAVKLSENILRDRDGYCRICGKCGHASDCEYYLNLAAIKEVLK